MEGGFAMGASSSSPEPLDVFRMHRELIGDYRQFTEVV